MGAGQSVKIGEEIGRGAYGTVHKGTYHGRRVAIKRIHTFILYVLSHTLNNILNTSRCSFGYRTPTEMGNVSKQEGT